MKEELGFSAKYDLVPFQRDIYAAKIIVPTRQKASSHCRAAVSAANQQCARCSTGAARQCSANYSTAFGIQSDRAN